MRMRKLFAGLAAAATLLSGLALGATANAAETPKLPYLPLAQGQVDDQGKVTANATFKFTADDASQWGKNTNRVIKAYKLADYYQYVDAGAGTADDPQSAVFGVQTVDAAKEGVRAGLTTALSGVTATPDDPHKDANGKIAVPTDTTDLLAWALQYGYLDQSATKPWANKDGSDPAVESTTRKFADSLNTDENRAKLGAPTTLSVATKNLTVNGKSASASLPAGIYLFLDTTEVANDGNYIQDGDTNGDLTGKVVVNSAPIILASGHLTADPNATSNPVNYLYPLGDINAGDNTVAFKNHVTPISKTVSDADKTVSSDQVVRYTLDTTLPLVTGTTNYQFSVTDKPGAGQTIYLNGIAGKTETDPEYKGAKYTVKIYDVKNDGSIDTTKQLVQLDRNAGINGAADFAVTNTAGQFVAEVVGGQNASLKFDFAPLLAKVGNQYAGKALRIEFDAKITATKDPVTNDVEVSDRNAVAKDSTRLTLGGFSFTKTDAQSNADASINGATFTIEADAATADNKAVAPGEPDRTNTGLVAKYDKDGDKSVSDEELDHVADPWKGAGVDESDSRVVDAKNGIVTFTGLADGVYTVTETKAPNGYLGDAYYVKFKVTITNGKAVYFDGIDKWGLAPNSADNRQNGNEITDYKVKNVRNITELPKTGAAGIMFFTVVGLLLAGAAGTIYLKSRRASRALRA